ncbi:hypothetical protein [Streptomyces sp. NPDC058457]
MLVLAACGVAVFAAAYSLFATTGAAVAALAIPVVPAGGGW